MAGNLPTMSPLAVSSAWLLISRNGSEYSNNHPTLSLTQIIGVVYDTNSGSRARRPTKFLRSQRFVAFSLKASANITIVAGSTFLVSHPSIKVKTTASWRVSLKSSSFGFLPNSLPKAVLPGVSQTSRVSSSGSGTPKPTTPYLSFVAIYDSSSLHATRTPSTRNQHRR